MSTRTHPFRPSPHIETKMKICGQGRGWLKLALLLVLAIGSAGFLFRQLRTATRTGEAGTRVWFYDQSEKRLYGLSAGMVPPHKGVGGQSGDGVRAVVVNFRTEHDSRVQRRIAYLQTYASELSQLLQQIQDARAPRRPYSGLIPSRDSDFFQTNTLVRRPDDTAWQSSNTPEAQRIISEWRSWRGPDGQPPIPDVPD
jgi:hypothetical protein